MSKKLIYLLAAMLASVVSTLPAEESANATGGTLTVRKKNFTLKHVLAYEIQASDEDGIAVVLTGQAVSSGKLEKVREAERNGGDAKFSRPFLKLVFSKAGEFKYWSAEVGSTTLQHLTGDATGELKSQVGRAIGQARQPLDAEAMFPSEFDIHFDVPLLKTGEALTASAVKKGGPAANVRPTVSGVFKGNGKDAKLAFVSAHWGDPFDGKAGIVLVGEGSF